MHGIHSGSLPRGCFTSILPIYSPFICAMYPYKRDLWPPRKASGLLTDKAIDHERVLLMMGFYYCGAYLANYWLRLLTIHIISADSPTLYKREIHNRLQQYSPRKFRYLSHSYRSIPNRYLLRAKSYRQTKTNNHEQYAVNHGRNRCNIASSLTHCPS